MGETRPGQARRDEAKAAGGWVKGQRWKRRVCSQAYLCVHAVNCYCCCPLSLMSLVFGGFHRLAQYARYPGGESRPFEQVNRCQQHWPQSCFWICSAVQCIGNEQPNPRPQRPAGFQACRAGCAARRAWLLQSQQ